MKIEITIQFNTTDGSIKKSVRTKINTKKYRIKKAENAIGDKVVFIPRHRHIKDTIMYGDLAGYDTPKHGDIRVITGQKIGEWSDTDPDNNFIQMDQKIINL